MMENGKIFQQLIPEIVKIYGDLLVSVILYGSVARGTQTDESDIDIAVMLRSKENADMKERMTDIIVDLELEHNKVLSVLRIDYEKFRTWEDIMPFYKNLKEDGIILWQAA
ncbi:MAG: nucleotidyltransferase domain-containing protein [Lachnospiraceae bacterium]|nr:nucleotidyltransferase domain-containing protein [Lachnospiraceae bacterium]